MPDTEPAGIVCMRCYIFGRMPPKKENSGYTIGDVKTMSLDEALNPSATEPAGCPGCNPVQVLPWLDAHKLVALDVKPDSPGSIACEQCSKSWWVVSLETAESP